jgi:hypothetical protein
MITALKPTTPLPPPAGDITGKLQSLPVVCDTVSGAGGGMKCEQTSPRDDKSGSLFMEICFTCRADERLSISKPKAGIRLYFHVFRFTDDEVLTNIQGVAREIGRIIKDIEPPPAPPLALVLIHT